jgi:hypothetical protein
MLDLYTTNRMASIFVSAVSRLSRAAYRSLERGSPHGLQSSPSLLAMRRPLSLASFFRRRTVPHSELTLPKPKLSPDNLFHPLPRSPIDDLRKRGAFITRYGICPVCEEEAGAAFGEQRRGLAPTYVCPDCGYPSHCSEQHYLRDLGHHKEHVCAVLRETNEDDHDLLSGRQMFEFEFPSKLLGGKRERSAFASMRHRLRNYQLIPSPGCWPPF